MYKVSSKIKGPKKQKRCNPAKDVKVNRKPVYMEQNCLVQRFKLDFDFLVLKSVITNLGTIWEHCLFFP